MGPRAAMQVSQGNWVEELTSGQGPDGQEPDGQGPDAAIARRAVVRSVLAALLAIGIFALDTLAPIDGGFAILYLGVLVFASGSTRRTWAWGALCGMLAIASWVIVHVGGRDAGSLIRLGFELLAIWLTQALLAQRQAVHAVQTQLAESQAEMVTFADSVPHMLWRSTAKGEWDFLNRRFTEITGVPIEEGIARQTWRQCVHPDDIGPLRERLERSQVTGEDVSGQVRLRMQDGSYRWMSMARRAVRSPVTGEIIRFYGGAFDIHEEVLAQQKVRELLETMEQRVEERTRALLSTEARYASLFDVGNISFAEMDFSGTLPILARLREEGVTDLVAHLRDHPDLCRECLGLIRTTRVNRALARLMGYADLAELAANPPAENAEDGEAVLLRQLDMAFTGKDHIDGETMLTGKDGQRIPVYYTVNRLADGLHVSSILNMTEQARIAELHRAAQDELARANRVATIGAYSATLAHELNQPIASMVMDVQTTLRWLRAPAPDIAAALRVVERLTRTVDRISGIVARTRDSLTAHRRRPEPFDLGALAAETCELLRPAAGRMGAAIDLVCAPGLPEVTADPIELQQVLVNLVTNAVEAMAGEPAPRRVTLVLMACDTGVRVEVRDTGPGIPDDQLARLFEPFYTTKAAGMGLGLQVCRNVVEGMGSTLEAGNRPEGGAVFAFTLRQADF